MAKPLPPWAPYAVAGLGLSTLAAATVAVVATRPKQLCRGWVDPSTPQKIRELAKPIERKTNLHGLGDFLAGISWIESRGNPTAGSSYGNAARGALGMRPESARTADLGFSGNALKDLPTAVALATWYIHRCIPLASPGQEIDWLALRRCWGYPRDVPKVDHPGYRNQLAEGLRCAGVDPSFMFEKAIRWNYTWPGIDAVLAAVGRRRA
jgi:hypothetical protein